ncbi:hypothetical protein [Haloarcula salinisoli]|uniref:Uncharacterized protein n=1 Tax=Haloarcula salinisoli TaxID=2487746 RepID=A0A8J7YM24_9EURY|nr:hypothetical protein [Halomicroarcula salinisoli]MBX0284839.1 hypothetical protein [Halomicroarcula salinisoli]MBX0303683.1 hypothetical protein [Halomicroarcula salinisoli]
MNSPVATATAYRIAETDQRINAVEFELHFQFGLWTVVDHDEDRWVVRNRDGERLTIRPV